MTNKKATPLKDEPVGTIDEVREELSACVRAIESLMVKLDKVGGMSDTDKETLRNIVGKAAADRVRELLEARQKKFKEEEEALKANGQMTTQEYINSLSERYDDVLERLRAFVDLSKIKFKKILDENSNTVKEIYGKLENIQSLCSVNGGSPATSSPSSSSSLRFSEGQSFKEKLKIVALNVAKRIYHSWQMRLLVFLCVFTFWFSSLCIFLLSAGENERLRESHEKYILLRDYSRLYKKWADHADFIEWLYSDKEEHQNEINRLWVIRQNRLKKKAEKQE